MSDLKTWPRSAVEPCGVVTEFFERLQQHDVDGMASLCSTAAHFHYVPMEFRAKRHVQRAQGGVHSIGKVIWHGLFSAFPDLSVTVQSMVANEDGDVVVQTELAGTQQRAWGLVAPTGRGFKEPHLFVMRVDENQLIDSITAYWNDASIVQQLGHREVD